MRIEEGCSGLAQQTDSVSVKIKIMEGLDAHLTVIRPKPLHKPPKNEFLPKHYDILMLDSSNVGSDGRPLKQLAKTLVPYEDHPLEKSVEYLYLFTGADRGGIKALRAVFVPPSMNEPESNRREMTKAALFCLIVPSTDKLNQAVVDHLPTNPGFYDLNHMFESNFTNLSSNPFTKQTRIMLTRLKCWLEENQNKPDFVEALLRKSAQERLVMSVDNPCYISKNKPIVKSFHSSRSFQETFADRCSANESFTKMMAIEKCDKVVINALFGSGLQYKHRVDAYSINNFWGMGKPDTTKIRLAPAVMASRTTTDFLNYPVHKLAYEGDANAITNHLRMGASAKKRDHFSWFPLHYAAWFGHVEACKVLVQDGKCSVNVTTSEDLWTPLHHAALNGQRYVVEYLLSLHSTDVNALDENKYTALNLCEKSQKPKFVKCKELLKAAMNKPYDKVEVLTIDEDNPSIMLNLVSNDNTTVTQLQQQILKELNIPRRYDRFFTFWICSPSLQIQLKRDHLPIQQMRDWETQVKLFVDAPKKNERPKLYWKRDVRLGVSAEIHTPKNPNAISLLFKEAFYNYIKALYPCDEADALRLAAILLQIKLGDFEAARAKRFLENDVNMQSIVPFTLLRQHKQNWVPKIIHQYKKISNDCRAIPDQGTVINEMHYNFLWICWNLTVYGSTFFEVAQVGKNNKTVPMIIGINDIGLHAIVGDTKQMQSSFHYEEIDWNKTKPGDEPGVEMKIRGNNRVIIYRTKQAPLICQLMKRLSDIVLARTK